jgi:hypothetical protein
MSGEISKADIERILTEEHQRKTSNLLGSSIDELTIKDSNISLKTCKECDKEFRVADFELEEDNAAILWRACQGLAIDDYCVGSEPTRDGAIAYRFCYNDPCLDTVKNAIIKMDTIQAIARGRNKTRELCLNRVQHNRKLTQGKVKEMFENMSESFVSERARMWHEIDEGLRRFLIMPADETKNEAKIEGETTSQNGFLTRSFHSHQFRDLIRRDRYNVAQQKPDAVMFGHFHLLMVFRRFDTWVVTTGHFTANNMQREKGFISHVGSPIMLLKTKNNEPIFKINRARIT